MQVNLYLLFLVRASRFFTMHFFIGLLTITENSEDYSAVELTDGHLPDEERPLELVAF